METLTKKAKVFTGFWICKKEDMFSDGEKVNFFMGPRDGLMIWLKKDGRIAGSTTLKNSLERDPIIDYSFKDNKILYRNEPTGFYMEPDSCRAIYGPEKKMPWENLDLKAWTNFYKSVFG